MLGVSDLPTFVAMVGCWVTIIPSPITSSGHPSPQELDELDEFRV